MENLLVSIFSAQDFKAARIRVIVTSVFSILLTFLSINEIDLLIIKVSMSESNKVMIFTFIIVMAVKYFIQFANFASTAFNQNKLAVTESLLQENVVKINSKIDIIINNQIIEVANLEELKRMQIALIDGKFELEHRYRSYLERIEELIPELRKFVAELHSGGMKDIEAIQFKLDYTLRSPETFERISESIYKFRESEENNEKLLREFLEISVYKSQVIISLIRDIERLNDARLKSTKQSFYLIDILVPILCFVATIALSLLNIFK